MSVTAGLSYGRGHLSWEVRETSLAILEVREKMVWIKEEGKEDVFFVSLCDLGIQTKRVVLLPRPSIRTP